MLMIRRLKPLGGLGVIHDNSLRTCSTKFPLVFRQLLIMLIMLVYVFMLVAKFRLSRYMSLGCYSVPQSYDTNPQIPVSSTFSSIVPQSCD